MITQGRLAFICTIYFCLLGVAPQCTKRKDVDEKCHFIVGDTVSGQADNCSIVTCETLPSFNVTDNRRGLLKIALPAVYPQCNFTRYDIALRVRDSSLSTEPVPCATQDSEWKTHSRRNVNIVYCAQTNATCIAETLPCNKVHEVTFGYIYTGWYQVKIIPHLGPNTRQSQRSKPVHINTTYIPKGLVDLNDTISSLQYRDDKGEIRLLISNLSVEGATGTIKLFDSVCDGTGALLKLISFSDETDGRAVECTASNNGSTPNCSATKNSVQCVFRNMTPGAYCAVLTFYDDRCEVDTIWTGPDNKPCQWQAYKEFEAEDATKSTVVDSSSGLIYLVIGILIVAAAVTGVLILIHRHRARRRELSAHQALSPERPRFIVEQPTTRHFSLANQFTLTERPRPEVLLLYSRDSKPFMDLVAALRKVLDKICKCHVYDYFDEAHWNTVSVDPEGWVRELIAEREAKVVVIASRVAALRHNSRGGDAIALRDPHPFDHLFLFALKLMRDIANEDSYRNHFVVSFDGYTDSSHHLEDFNPYTRFVLPKHLNKLFEHLHDSSSTVHFDTNRRLEERDEVRQLRLRLEHLINVQLLSKNELGQIYDW